jgi:hypothetical protein
MVRVRVPKWREFNSFGLKCQSCKIIEKFDKSTSSSIACYQLDMTY